MTGLTRTRWLTVTVVALGLTLGPSAAASAAGRQLWVQRYDGPAHDRDLALSVAVSPDGSRVFSTGGSLGITSGYDYVTAAYDSSTGVPRWVRQYNGPGTGDDIATSITVSPGATKVSVTGQSAGVGGFEDYATLAHDASTGCRIWLSRYDSPWDNSDYATSIAVAPGGTKVFVAGSSWGDPGGWDYATVAYSAGDGTKLWVRPYDGPGHWYDAANPIAVGPDGTRVFVTGASTGAEGDDDHATVAYSA